MTRAKMYFECHITIEPVFDERLSQIKEIATRHGFRVADLLFQKRKEDTPTLSKYDTFMTMHHVFLEDMKFAMINLISELIESGFKVLRYKIEDIVLDSRIEDCYNLVR